MLHVCPENPNIIYILKHKLCFENIEVWPSVLYEFNRYRDMFSTSLERYLYFDLILFLNLVNGECFI